MAKRVFELAKELGVRSKDVLEKCRAEGLELKNHMAALSAGLQATIQEWFSAEAGHGTAVETAKAVDVSAARKRAAAERRRRKKAEAEEQAVAESAGGDAVAVAEVSAPECPPAETEDVALDVPTEPSELAPAAEAAPAEVVAEPAATVVADAPALAPEAAVQTVAETAVAPAEAPVAQVPGVEEAAPVAEAPITEPTAAEAPVAEAPAAEAPVAEAPGAEVVAAPEASGTPEVPEAIEAPEAPVEPAEPGKKPGFIAPAGPQVVPRPAKLQGPRVIRVVQPDILPQRRPAPRRPAPGPAAGGQPAPTDIGVGRRGRGTAPAAATEEDGKGKGGKAGKRRSPRRRGGRAGEGVRQWRDRDISERRERLAAASGGGLRRHRASVRRPGEPVSGDGGPCEVDEPITIKSLSAAMAVKATELIKKLMAQGTLATVNHTITAETAESLATEFGVELKIKHQKSARERLVDNMAEQGEREKTPRPPVVTFLGHVDHGKTSLLDKIRSETVVDTESGGITQHIGAYQYRKGDAVVTFLDTPGHEAFTEMRSRGANMTDVVVLVVAADDGVMPQTVEAISHAKAAEVPIVVALNKIDVPNANINRVMGQLAEHGLQPREWGGETEVIQTSAIKGDGIDDLIELLSLEAEMLELTARTEGHAAGAVIEAEMAAGRGVVARLLVREGTLRPGDVILAGAGSGRVRQILDHRGKSIDEAGPAMPIEVIGLDAVPSAGDKFYVLDDISEAKRIAEEVRNEQREAQLFSKQQVTLDNLFSQITAGDVSELPLIVKADVQGSSEVLIASLNKLSTDEVRVKILHAGVGGISTSDVLLAEASGAIILGFHVVPDAAAREAAEKAGVDIRLYRVIYHLTEEVTKAMSGLLAPEIKEESLGHAEVREVFRVTKVGTVAGCFVTNGLVRRNAKIRLIRDSIVIEDERQIDTLKRFKDDAREVRNGFECGIKLAGYDDVKVGDIFEAYETVEVARTL